jgi:hypothetical protein
MIAMFSAAQWAGRAENHGCVHHFPTGSIRHDAQVILDNEILGLETFPILRTKAGQFQENRSLAAMKSSASAAAAADRAALNPADDALRSLGAGLFRLGLHLGHFQHGAVLTLHGPCQLP